MLADLFELPEAGDLGLRCTNLRTLDGKRPVFVDDIKRGLLLPVPAHPVRRDPAARRWSAPSSRSRSMPSRVAVAAPPAPPTESPTRTTSRSTRTSSAASARSDAATPVRARPSGAPRVADSAEHKGPCRTRCYTPGRAKEPRHRRIAGQGADHRALPRARTTGSSRRTATSATCPRTPARASSASTSTTTSSPSTSSATTGASRSTTSRRRPRARDLVFLATDLDREGEAIAWHVAEAANVPADKTRRVTFSEITEPRDPRGVRQPARHRPEPRRRAADPPHRRPARRLHAQPAARRARSAAACRPVASSRWRSASSSSASARSTAFTAREYWTIEAILATAAGETFAAELVRIDGEALDVADEATAERHVGRAPRREARSCARSASAPRSARRRRRSRPRPSSRRRAASCRSARSGRCRSPSGCTRAPTRRTATSASSPTCEPTRPRSPASRWARPARSSASATASRSRCPRAASTRPSRRAPRRRTSRSARRRSGATRTRWPACSSPRSCGCTA